jgi:hypothetical protein
MRSKEIEWEQTIFTVQESEGTTIFTVQESEGTIFTVQEWEQAILQYANFYHFCKFLIILLAFKKIQLDLKKWMTKNEREISFMTVNAGYNLFSFVIHE